MSTPTAQTLAFIYPAGSPMAESEIFNDTGVQAAAALSTDNNVLIAYQDWYNFTSGLVQQTAFTLTFMVSDDDAATIAAMIPDMITRMATAQPNMTTIESWSAPCVYS